MFALKVETLNPDLMDFFLSEQDRGLDALSEAIQRQKLIGHVISDEVDTQNGKNFNQCPTPISTPRL